MALDVLGNRASGTISVEVSSLHLQFLPGLCSVSDHACTLAEYRACTCQVQDIPSYVALPEAGAIVNSHFVYDASQFFDHSEVDFGQWVVDNVCMGNGMPVPAPMPLPVNPPRRPHPQLPPQSTGQPSVVVWPQSSSRGPFTQTAFFGMHLSRNFAPFFALPSKPQLIYWTLAG